MTFNFHTAIGRYFYDKESDSDFKDFLGTALILLFLAIIPFLIIFFFFTDEISNILTMPAIAAMLIPLAVIGTTTGSIYNQIMQPLYQSRKIAIPSIISSYAAFVLSLVLILIMTSQKYMGQILAQVIIGIIFFFYYMKELRPFINLTFKKKYFKYIFSYSIPLIPYALNGIILAQIDRVQINMYEGASSVGLYSFAYNIAMLMSVFSVTLFQTWTPRYFEYMNARDYISHDKDIHKLNKYLVIVAAFLILFGMEVGYILADKKFHPALSIIPIVVISYYFEAIFTIFARHIGFAKRTIYATLIALASGVLNIFLNTIYIPMYGYKAAAWTTFASYLTMTILGYLVSAYVLKIHTTRLWLIAKTGVLLIPITFVTYLVGTYIENIILGIMIKLIIFVIPAYYLLPSNLIPKFIRRDN
jgi:O-antigen/teichoic acid export membrane protein